MANGAVRQLMRRLIPRRVRWLARAAFRRITGLYYRDLTARLDSDLRLYIETQGEVMDLILRRLRVSQEEVDAHLRTVAEQVAARLSTLEEQVATQMRTVEERTGAHLQTIQEQLNALAQPIPKELSARIVEPLNLDRTHLGFRARFGLWINDPIAVEYTPERVRWTHTNERVVEIPFVFQAISALAPPARIIDIGASESLIALELASFGYQVTALDIRSYGFTHPNLTVVKASILDWDGGGQTYYAAIVLSTLEHLGLPLYDQTRVEEDADERAIAKMHSLLRPGGLLVLTTPFGPSRTQETQRVYSATDLARLFDGFRIQRCCVAGRQDEKTWVIDAEVPFSALHKIEGDNQRDRVVLVTAERA